MRVPDSSQRRSLTFDMTPMIDVVFQLIIFFLLSSHFAQQEVQLEMSLPRAGTGLAVEDETTRRIIVNVMPDGGAARLLVGGRVVSHAELADIIQFDARESGRALQVRIRTDRRVPYRTVEPVMVACARAGVWQVSFAVVGD